MEVNIYSVLVGAFASLIIGWIWYGPIFGKAWMSVLGIDNITPEMKEKMKKEMFTMLFLQFIFSVITVFVLAKFVAMMSVPSISTALWVWFGFVMTILGGGAIWSGKTPKNAFKMFLLTAGCQLVTFLAYGFILNAMR